MNNIADTFLSSINKGVEGVVAFFPNFLAGIIIFLIGVIVASIARQVFVQIFNVLKVEKYLKKYGVPEAKKELTWTNILAEIVRWFVLILFLIPTADVWGIPQVTTVLNTFLLYLPNVFVAAIIGLVGLVLARLAGNLVQASVTGLSSDAANTIASVTKISLTVFVLLAVLNQLGVAQDLVRILFTGFVAMIALAGGIAFGLGGRDAAKSVVDEAKKKFK